MVRKLKDKSSAPSGGISAEDLKRVVKEHQRQTSQAQEYNGRAGQAVKTFVEANSVDRKAFSFVLGLAKMEEVKRQATLRQVLELAHKLEMFASVDAFDDILDRMDKIVEEVRANAEKPKKADSVVGQVLGGASLQ